MTRLALVVLLAVVSLSTSPPTTCQVSQRPWLVVPTVAASVVATKDERTLFGGEAGIIYGAKDSGHGFYGLSGYRFCVDVVSGQGATVVGVNGGLVLENWFVIRLRGGVYNDLGKNTTLLFLPELGFSHNGIICLTVGGMLPLLGSNAIEPSVRVNLTWNMFSHD